MKVLFCQPHLLKCNQVACLMPFRQGQKPKLSLQLVHPNCNLSSVSQLISFYFQVWIASLVRFCYSILSQVALLSSKSSSFYWGYRQNTWLQRLHRLFHLYKWMVHWLWFQHPQTFFSYRARFSPGKARLFQLLGALLIPQLLWLPLGSFYWFSLALPTFLVIQMDWEVHMQFLSRFHNWSPIF